MSSSSPRGVLVGAWMLLLGWLASCGGRVTTSQSMGTGGASPDAGAAQLGGSQAGGAGASGSGASTGGSSQACQYGSAFFCGSSECSSCPSNFYCEKMPAPAQSFCSPSFDCTIDCDEQACVFESQPPPRLTCAPTDYCRYLASLGMNICVFPDETPWVDMPVIQPPATCPSVTGISLCNGPCGDCPANNRCVMVSPTHPIGICLPITNGAGLFYRPCGDACTQPDVCGSYPPTAPMLENSMNLGPGLCLPLSTCQSLAANLPGGFVCH